MNVGSLFSGIGGFDLGLERAGFRTAWFCEQDEFCRRVLAKHWPGVPCYGDICELRGAAVESVDVLCGGFPCQDISVAGAGAGIDGTRSGLWSEYARLIGELRPRYVLVENVSALLARGLGRVLGDLSALGYDAEWDCLPASAFGAPHQRDRVWLVAYPGGARRRQDARSAHGDEGENAGRTSQDDHVLGGPRAQRLRAVAHDDTRCGERRWPEPDATQLVAIERCGEVADSERLGCAGGTDEPAGQARPGPHLEPQGAGLGRRGWWESEPDVGRVAHGVPARVDRLRSLGNALVPQIAEWIGGRVMAYELENA